jgi:hypothetical protein
VAPAPSIADEIAAIVQTVDELWVIEDIEEIFPKVKSLPLVVERLEQSIGSFPVTVNVSEVELDVVADLAKVTVGSVASTEIVIEADVDAFPAVSVSVTVTTQSPSTSVVSSQAFEEIVHETLDDPFLVAVRTAVPEKLPATVNVGVLSLVLLSEFEDPLSEPLCKSGVDGVGRVVELITTPISAGESLELTPLTLCFEVKAYVWFASAVVKVHESVELEATKIQVTALPLDGVAVRVTVAPVTNPVRFIVGVLSAVALSVAEIPVSDEAERSATKGALTLVLNATSDTREIFPALSRTTMYAFKSLPCVRAVTDAVLAAASAVPESDLIDVPRATTVAAEGAESDAG